MTACYQAPSRAIARDLAKGIRADYAGSLPSAVACFEDDFEACIAHLRLPVGSAAQEWRGRCLDAASRLGRDHGCLSRACQQEPRGLRERFLSHRLHADEEAELDAACAAWQRLINEPGRLQTLCAYPLITEITL